MPAALQGMRRYALDDALLLFDPKTGLTAICDGEPTRGLRRRVPRVVQFALTNACDRTCAFCSRDAAAPSLWTADEAAILLRDLSRAGVLEVAFGGGEPLLFREFEALLERLHRETALAVSLTTNGSRLDDALLDRIEGRYAQIRVSAYDDGRFEAPVRRLAARGAPFGINRLLTPANLPRVEDELARFVELGCRDVLWLAYKGDDRSMHLSPDAQREAARRLALLARAFAGRVELKLDICWGGRMASVPQLFGVEPCAAGADFVVISSDKMLRPCSFHDDVAIPVTTAASVLDAWSSERGALASASRRPGCARAPGCGLPQEVNP